jgi:hypothetical protein
MAGIIIYGKQLHNIATYNDLVEMGIISYATIYSLFL